MPAACSFGFEALDAERVDHDVLRGRGGRDQDRAERDQPRRLGGIGEREEHDRRHQQQLREHEPAAPPPEQARQHRHVERIDQRRPQELDGVGRADQREQADGAEIDAGLAHPHQQGRAGERERQPGGKAEEHHDQHARAQIDARAPRPNRRLAGALSSTAAMRLSQGASERLLANQQRHCCMSRLDGHARKANRWQSSG